MHLKERITAPGPKKILALDGGGIRGILTLEILVRLEATLREKLGRQQDFVLADFFDFFAGTSTGAIIAAGLAMGMPVAQVREFYLTNGKAMFDKVGFFKRLRMMFRYAYTDSKLRDKLKEVYGEDTLLGSEKLRSLLLMVLRNASTDSPWPLSNNPFAKYNQRERADCNLNLPLWQLVRASAAAPVYFPPEEARIGKQTFVFVDGGITPYNNPAFQAFLMATLEPYHLNWTPGESQLLIVSLGTGTSPDADAYLSPDKMSIFYNAGKIPGALMYAALNEQDLLCRAFGNCLAGDPFDREVGDLIGQKGPVQPKLFTYMRYNAELTREGLDKLGLSDIDPEKVQKLDSIAHIADLQRIGRAVAEQKIRGEHFQNFIERG